MRSLPSRRDDLLAVALVGAALVLCPLLLWRWLSISDGMSDFAAFRSFAVFAGASDPALIYEPARLVPYQRALHGLALPYLYHPGMLLLFRPLAWMPPGLGRAVWSAASAGSFVLSLAAFRSRPRWLLAGAALGAPATLMTLAMGQNTLLIASLLIGGMRLLPGFPALAGCCFGLAALKPQFGILIPVMLVARGEWRAIAASVGTGGLIVAASIVAFGPGVWIAWACAGPAIGHMLPTPHDPHLGNMPTVLSMALQLGTGLGAARLIQAGVSMACVVVVWRRARATLREGNPEFRDAMLAASVLAASLLATPYAFAYDLPIVAGAALIAMRSRADRAVPFAPFEMPLMMACLMLPFLHRDGLTLPVAPVVIGCFLWFAGRPDRKAAAVGPALPGRGVAA